MSMAGLTYACSSRAELRAAKGRQAALVGMACSTSIPQGSLVSWGFNGSLVSDLSVGEPTEGVRVVDINGNEMWARDPELPSLGFREVTVLDIDRVIDHPIDRLMLATNSGAHVVDRESGILARTGRLHRIVRVVSDNPGNTLHLVAFVLKMNGSVDWKALTWALRIDPWGTTSSLARLYFKAQRALSALQIS